MTLKLTPGRILACAIVALSFWIVHGFIQAVLAACVIAIASWPLYAWFAARAPRGMGRGTASAVFTCALTVLVLAPMVFACLALLGETQSLLSGLAAGQRSGLALPGWLASAPIAGPWLAARWQGELSHPGALLTLTQQTDATAVFGWAQLLGEFTVRHALLVAFTILLLFFLYQEGPSMAGALTGALRRGIGERAERYVHVATRAVRASVNSMLVVALFDGFATALAYAIAGTSRPLFWAAITGSLAAIPLLGYVAVAAMAVELAVNGEATPALLAPVLGCLVLLCGDKVVRPTVVRGGIRLPFVWVLMGGIGGFGVLGLAGLVVGPVVLTLAMELWEQWVRDCEFQQARQAAAAQGRRASACEGTRATGSAP